MDASYIGDEGSVFLRDGEYGLMVYCHQPTKMAPTERYQRCLSLEPRRDLTANT